MVELTEEERTLLRKHYPGRHLNPDPEIHCGELTIEWDLEGVLGFCGCGRPSDAALGLHRILCSLRSVDWGWDTPKDEVDRLYAAWRETRDEAFRAAGIEPDSPGYYLVMYWIDNMGWAEHGTGINGQWLEPKGEAAIVACKVLESDE